MAYHPVMSVSGSTQSLLERYFNVTRKKKQQPLAMCSAGTKGIYLSAFTVHNRENKTDRIGLKPFVFQAMVAMSFVEGDWWLQLSSKALPENDSWGRELQSGIIPSSKMPLQPINKPQGNANRPDLILIADLGLIPGLWRATGSKD